MRRSGLVAGALALQMMVMAASVSTAPPKADAPRGAGLWEGVLCAACVAGGAAALVTGGAEAAAVTLLVGGPAAVGLVTAVAGCVKFCAGGLK